MNTNRFRRLAAMSLLATGAAFTGFAIGCEDDPVDDTADAVEDAADDAGDAVEDAID
jgi:hypothetical protein